MYKPLSRRPDLGIDKRVSIAVEFLNGATQQVVADKYKTSHYFIYSNLKHFFTRGHVLNRHLDSVRNALNEEGKDKLEFFENKYSTKKYKTRDKSMSERYPNYSTQTKKQDNSSELEILKLKAKLYDLTVGASL